MTYLFPFSEVEKDSNIILYGAGAVGYEFYQQIRASGYCRIVKWVDAQYEWYQYIGLPVEPPEAIMNEVPEVGLAAADTIVIAVDKEEVCCSIRQELGKMGKEKCRIIWRYDYRLPGPEAAYRNRDRLEKDVEQTMKMSPNLLIDEERMDIVVRYLYAKALSGGEAVEILKAEKLYEKLIHAVNREEEPLANSAYAYFSDYEKKCGIDDFKKSFRELVFSMKEKGFRREHFIPIGKDGKMINGSHRLAAALALGKDVWTVRYEMLRGELFFHLYSVEWMRENGFSEEEAAWIWKAYEEIKA